LITHDYKHPILHGKMQTNNKMLFLTVMGLGSKIRVINFLALKESHGGQVKSADEICGSRNESHKMKTIERVKLEGKKCSNGAHSLFYTVP